MELIQLLVANNQDVSHHYLAQLYLDLGYLKK